MEGVVRYGSEEEDPSPKARGRLPRDYKATRDDAEREEGGETIGVHRKRYNRRRLDNRPGNGNARPRIVTLGGEAEGERETEGMTTPSAIYGVDPGATGGLAELDLSGSVLRFKTMPKTEQGVLDWIRGSTAPKGPIPCPRRCWLLGGVRVYSVSGKSHDARSPALRCDCEGGFVDPPSSRKILGGGVMAFVEEIPTAIFGADKSSGAKLYGSYMSLRMALTASGIRYRLVKARVWQAGLSIPPRRKGGKKKLSPTVQLAESRTDWKGRLKRVAEELFPKLKITLATSDALLIAEYGRRLLDK